MLDRVAHGEEILITRHDKAVARIVPEGKAPLSEVQAAVEGLFDLQKRISRRTSGKKLTDKEIRSAIDEGRR